MSCEPSDESSGARSHACGKSQIERVAAKGCRVYSASQEISPTMVKMAATMAATTPPGFPFTRFAGSGIVIDVRWVLHGLVHSGAVTDRALVSCRQRIDDALDVGEFYELFATAIPIVVKGTAEEAWLVFEENCRATVVADDWAKHLEQRKRSLLLGEYRRRYCTASAFEAPVTCTIGPDATEGSLRVFVSLVRDGFLVLSLWLTCAGEPSVPSTPLLSSAFTDAASTISFDSEHRGKGAWAWDGLLRSPIAGTSLAAPVRDSALQLFGGQVQLRGTSDDAFDHFEATVVTVRGGAAVLRPPVSSGSAADPPDWAYRVATLLPQIKGSPRTYRPEYLLDSLGTDTMDTAGGRYLLGRRRILALVDHDAANRPHMVHNLTTWSQLLSENAAVQLAAIRTHAELLHATITSSRSAADAARTLGRSQYDMYQDLDEAQNIAVSLDPVFWHHQETLKQVSGLAALSANLRERSSALASSSALDEQRTFAAATQTLAIAAGAFAVTAPTVEVGIDAELGAASLVALAHAAAVLGACLGWLLVIAVKRRGQHQTTRHTAP
jgi:hypothetical protein